MIIASDIGGARAIKPIIKPLLDNGLNVIIVDNGILPSLFEFPIKKINNSLIASKESFKKYITDNNITTLCFGTSVHDILPITIAKWSKELGIRTICVLDNWMNYKKRLLLNGELILPDIYAIMDEMAYNDAIDDGIPKEILQITGHPDLADITVDASKQFKESLNIQNKKLITFILEPVLLDQGDSPSNPSYRGYTEYDIMEKFYNAILPYKDEVHIAILPHPRQEKDKLYKFWNEICKDVSWNKIEIDKGRIPVLSSDNVVGMTSILLYEAWLAGIPALSFQPNLIRDDLKTLQRREGCFCVFKDNEIENTVKKWINSSKSALKQDLIVHKDSISKLCNIILSQ